MIGIGAIELLVLFFFLLLCGGIPRTAISFLLLNLQMAAWNSKRNKKAQQNALPAPPP